MIVKGHKRPKDLTGDRQNANIEGTRRTRNHRPTRKRKTRCYWHKGKKKKKKQNKRKMKCMQGYLDRSRRCQEVSTTGSRWIEVAIEHLESFSMDQSSYWECQKNSWRVLIDSNLLRAIEKLSRWAKIVFQRRGKQRLECNQACYPTKEPNNMLSFQNHLSTRKMLST